VSELEVGRGLERLNRLGRVLTEFAKEEGDLARSERERRYRLHRAGEERLENVERSRVARIDEAEAGFAEAKSRLAARHEARRSRIRRFQQEVTRNIPKLARAEREKWLGDLQMQEFLVTRDLTAKREAADAEFAEFSKGLDRQATDLRRLGQRAREYFTGYLSFLWMLRPRPESAPRTGLRDELAAALESRLGSLAGRLREFRRLPLPKVFGFVPLPVVIILLAVAVFLMSVSQRGGFSIVPVVAGGVLAVAVIGLHFFSRRQAKELAAAIANDLAEARALHDACRAVGAADYEQTCRCIQAAHEQTSERIGGEWTRGDDIKIDFEARVRQRLETRAPRALARNDRALRHGIDQRNDALVARIAAIQHEADVQRAAIAAESERALAEFHAGEADRWRDLEERWRRAIEPLYAEIATLNATAVAAFPAWSEEFVKGWAPAEVFTPATQFARLELDVPAPIGTGVSRLALPGPAHLSIPLALTYPRHGSLLFESSESGGATVLACFNHIVLRLLATTPPGKLSFTIIDPVGLGQNFAGLMHLGDYEESLISRHIWTQSDQIEERLADLSQHIEKVIQMYLRNEYATIVEYNEQAGSTAEKFHFLVIADFPVNFSETAFKRLQSILTSGPRCGVYTLIHWDMRQPLPSGLVADELRKSSICIQGGRDGARLENGPDTLDARLVLDAPPEPTLALELVHKIGARSIDASQVQVPFRAIAPEEAEFWKSDTTNELRVAIGRTGATKRQMLAIGKGTRQHALVAGKTGSGKSTLFHVMITNLALACSPEQVEFYLIDFKKGVEFKCYATKRLPHARVVAIESDREFGLSVLQRVDDELRRRGDLFRQLGVQDIAGYQRESGGKPMPRTLLLIDEFQEFFVEDDAVAQSASVLLDRIVRQGRAFGIHVVLGSQTLGGAYSLARATLGQMVIRIALQCNEADAYLIMDDNNAAPRLLSRPGEGIYNDAAGAVEGNSPFQVVWLPEEERDAWLDKVRGLAERNPGMDSTPVVFEGNAPADIAANALLARALASEPAKSPGVARAWLGAPNSIKGPTEVAFQRQSGNNLLIVGQRDEAALTMLGNALLALAAQYPAGGVRFVFVHNAAPDSVDLEFIERVVEACAQDVTVATNASVTEVINDLSEELRQREAIPGAPVFVFIHGLQRFKKLRYEEDYDFAYGDAPAAPKPGAQFAELIAEGSSHGIHLLASIDTFNSVNRFMSRKALGEFEMRVLFQMSANDSASLIDSPKAGALGLHRALFYNEHEGTLETFRPYAMPDAGWLRSASGLLAGRGRRAPGLAFDAVQPPA
jgi:hypothetical protein